jgi:hypothetical protein
MPKMVSQILSNRLNLLIKGQGPKVVTSLSSGNIKPSNSQALSQTSGELTAVAGQVVDGVVINCGHGSIVIHGFQQPLSLPMPQKNRLIRPRVTR